MSETRLEQIQKAAAADRRSGTWTGDWSPITLEDIEETAEVAFIRGAKWADANPIVPLASEGKKDG